MTDVHLSIGGIALTLSPADERVSCRIDEPLRQFSGPAAQADVRLTVRTAADEISSGGELLFNSGGMWRLFRQADGYRIEVASPVFGDQPYKVATLDPTFTRGEIAVTPRAIDAGLGAFDYPLDEVLVSQLLGRGRGVELHSCGVIDSAGRGHLFVGVSGAGKTTAARLWNGQGVVVSDDRVIIRDIHQELRMYGTPWHGEAQLCSPESAPLAGVYLLQQAKETRLRDLHAGEAVARLFRCTFPLFYDADALAFTVEFLARIVRAVPVRELQFTPDGSVVETVLAAVPDGG